LRFGKSLVSSRLKDITVHIAYIDRNRRFDMQESLGLSSWYELWFSPSPKQPMPGVSSRQPSFQKPPLPFGPANCCAGSACSRFCSDKGVRLSLAPPYSLHTAY
jgi:hypothetical protein